MLFRSESGTGASAVQVGPGGGTVTVDLIVDCAQPIFLIDGRPAAEAPSVIQVEALPGDGHVWAADGELGVFNPEGDWTGLQTAATVMLHVAPVPGTHRITFTCGYAVGPKNAWIPLRSIRPLEITVPNN